MYNSCSLNYIISQLLEVELSCQQTGENTCLCSHHYLIFYKLLTDKPCAACGKTPGKQKGFNRKCPDLKFINMFLQNHCGFEGEIKTSDHICKSCYGI